MLWMHINQTYIWVLWIERNARSFDAVIGLICFWALYDIKGSSFLLL